MSEFFVRPILTAGFWHHNLQAHRTRMKLACASLLGLLLGAGPILAQTTTTENSSSSQMTHDPAMATVAGIVTKDPGGELIKKALVEMIAENQTAGCRHTKLTRKS